MVRCLLSSLARPVQRPQHQVRCSASCRRRLPCSWSHPAVENILLHAPCTREWQRTPQVVPSTAIGFTLYDSAKQFLGLKGNI